MKRNFRQTTLTLFIALTFAFGFSVSASAQEITGTLNGTVRDSSGGAIAGATVTITDPTKNNITVRNLATGDEGTFSAPNLQSGVYQVTIEAPNFKKSVQTDVKLDVGQRRTIDLILEAGNISETVTVEADAVAVNLSTPTAGTTISGDQVREIPINNRNFIQLVALAPGVSNDLNDFVGVGTTTPETGTVSTVQISVNGGRSSQNTFTVDGADITDRGSNLTIQAYPSVDSIGEFKVLRSLYPAESGRSGGGQVNIVTRSGGDKFHGSAFEFVRNEVFNANNFLTNASTTPLLGRDKNGKARRNPFRYNDYGFTIGGPIYFLGFGEGVPAFKRYEKTFFFFSEEIRKDRRFTTPQQISVPDAALRQGIFPIDVCINLNNVATETCTGAGRLTMGQSIFSTGRVNPVALSYLNGIYNKLPLPNAGNINGNPYLLNTTAPNRSDFRQEILKIDHTFSNKLSTFYRFENDKIPSLDAYGLFGSGSGLPGVATTATNSPGRTHTVQATYALSSKVIIEGSYNHAYGAILSENVGSLALSNTNIAVTLPYANQRDRVPTLQGNGFAGLTGFGPYDNFSTKSQYNASLTTVFGNHTTKYGASFSQYRKNENALAGSNEGNYSAFSATLATGLTLPTETISTATAQNLQRFANFLVGNVTTFTQARFDYTADLRQKVSEAFIQDEYRVRRNLTLYYGVRYSYFGSPYDKNGRLSNFDPTRFNPADAPQVTGAGQRVAGTGNFCNGLVINSQNVITAPPEFNCRPTVSAFGDRIIKVSKKDFAPRVGLAFDPFGKGRTSIRTGYGIYHEQVLNGTFEQNIGTNPPYQQTVTATNTRLDNPGGGFSAPLTPQSIRALQSDWKTPYMQHWSLDVQHQLTSKTLIDVGYYGSKGTHLIGLTELNDLPPGLALNSNCINAYNQTVRCQTPGYVFRNASGIGLQAVPNNPNADQTAPTVRQTNDILILDQLRPYRGYRSIAIVQPRYNSNYNSLQVYVQHRFTGASQVNVAYTFAKNLTDSQNDRSAAPQDTYNSKAEKARAALDRRHVFTTNFVYELPFFNKQENLIGKILGGFQTSGIVTYQTGLPFTAVTSNLDFAGLGLINANPTARPNVTCNPNVNAPHTRTQFFNTACFQMNPSNIADTAALGFSNTPGNAGRGIIFGPRTVRVDLTATKNIRFGETIRLQLRAEAFNVFNTTNFRGFTSLNVTSGSFGVIGSTRDPRTMQLGAKFSF